MDGTLRYSIEGEATSLNNAVKSSINELHRLGMEIAATAAKAGLLAGAAGAAALAWATKVAAGREQVRVAFKNIIGDADEANRVLEDLFDFANVTPFESDEVIAAARKLLAAGVATKDLRDELTALGNVAAGVGTDIGGLATIYAQIMDKGKVMAEELMQFGERGAGAIKDQLAKSLGVSKAELIAMTTEGKVSFAQFQAALQQLAGAQGKWGKLMEEQSQTTLGLWSSLKDAVTGVANELGQPLNEAIKPVLSDAIGLANQLKPVVADVGAHVGAAVSAMRDFVAEAGNGGSVVANLAKALGAAVGNLWEYIAPIGQAFGTIALGFGKALYTAIEPVGIAFTATMMSAGYRLKGLLLEVMSELPGMGHLKNAATEAHSKGLALSTASKQQFNKLPSAGDQALDIIAESIKEAGDQVRSSWDEAGKRQRNAEKDAAMRKAEEDFAKQDQLRGEADLKAAMQRQDNARSKPKSGTFGSNADGSGVKITDQAGRVIKDTTKDTNTTKQADAAGEAAKNLKDAAQSAKQMADSRAEDALQKTARAATTAAAGLGQLANQGRRTRDPNERGIHGYSQQREAMGEYARKKWDRTSKGEKERYGNDPSRWLQESSQGQAANRAMQGARQALTRKGEWNPAVWTNLMNQRTQSLSGSETAAPRAAAPQPQAATQDSSTRVLLQQILEEMRRMASGMNNLARA